MSKKDGRIKYDKNIMQNTNSIVNVYRKFVESRPTASVKWRNLIFILKFTFDRSFHFHVCTAKVIAFTAELMKNS